MKVSISGHNFNESVMSRAWCITAREHTALLWRVCTVTSEQKTAGTCKDILSLGEEM